MERPLPSVLLTEVRPPCEGLEPWVTVAVVNWSDEVRPGKVQLAGRIAETMKSSEFLVFDFFSQKVLGVYAEGDMIALGNLEPHQSALPAGCPMGRQPSRCWLARDLHFSGGAARRFHPGP